MKPEELGFSLESAFLYKVLPQEKMHLIKNGGKENQNVSKSTYQNMLSFPST